MAGNEVTQKQNVGKEYKTPIDVFQAASGAFATALSGHTTLTSAGVSIIAAGTSNVVRLRMVGAHLRNLDNNWLEVRFLDGALNNGAQQLSPIMRLNPLSERIFQYHELLGRAALSSIALVITSSPNSPPVSNGVEAYVAFVAEQLDFYES